MARELYIPRKFKRDALELIERANTIIAEYQAQGFTLTLRQLYYQFVARGILPNSIKSYSRLGATLNKARLAGLVDWAAIDSNDALRVLVGELIDALRVGAAYLKTPRNEFPDTTEVEKLAAVLKVDCENQDEWSLILVSIHETLIARAQEALK